MRNKWIALPVVLLAFAMFANAQTAYTLDVLATLGPNYGGPSYDTFAANVIDAVKNGTTSGGSGPAAYNFISNSSGLIGTIAPNQPIVSTFNSWQGSAAPGGAYAGEFGTSVYFVLHITTLNDALFSLSQLLYSETDPPDAYPTETYGFDYSGSDYASDLIGRNGATWIDSGAGTQQVSELIYVGENKGWEYDPFASPLGSSQAELDSVRDLLAGFAGQYITGRYSLVSAAGAAAAEDEIASSSAAVQFEAIPEPGTIALAAMGFAAMLLVRRKR